MIRCLFLAICPLFSLGEDRGGRNPFYLHQVNADDAYIWQFTVANYICHTLMTVHLSVLNVNMNIHYLHLKLHQIASCDFVIFS